MEGKGGKRVKIREGKTRRRKPEEREKEKERKRRGNRGRRETTRGGGS